MIVTKGNANDLITEPGNPHLIWDGAEARVVTEDFYRALNAESARPLIMSHADLAEIDPGAFRCYPASLAELLTLFAGDLAAEHCPGPAISSRWSW